MVVVVVWVVVVAVVVEVVMVVTLIVTVAVVVAIVAVVVVVVAGCLKKAALHKIHFHFQQVNTKLDVSCVHRPPFNTPTVSLCHCDRRLY